MYDVSVAVPAKKPSGKSLSERPKLQQTAVRLYSDGKSRSIVARMMAPYAYPEEYEDDPNYALRLMRKKLRSWEESQWFRDLVYDYSVAKLDSDVPQILRGMSRRARKRVDAARLVLEVTGRHNPKGEAGAPAVVQINFGGALPRPSNRPQLEEPIDGEITAEEDDEA